MASNRKEPLFPQWLNDGMAKSVDAICSLIESKSE
jgi:hypothetical protein